MIIRMFPGESRRHGYVHILHTLLSLEVVLDPHRFTFTIHPFERMASKAMHMTERGRNSAVRHENRNLMQRFRRQGPEIPYSVWILQMRLWMTFLRMNKVREFNSITDEEYRCVVANQIIVPFFGIEFHRKSSWIAYRIRRTQFTGYGGETDEQWSALPYFR
ncbi:hypothetical protein D3C81_1387870 [compost metagenome]